jgi:ketol-acid reductoisomerase
MANVRCQECKKSLFDIVEETGISLMMWDWIKLNNFLSYLRTEGIIEGETYEDMTDALLTLKPR